MDALDGDAEAILVDDGSSDRTYELMLEAARGRAALPPRQALAELRPPDRAHRGRRPRGRRRGDRAGRRPPGSARGRARARRARGARATTSSTRSATSARARRGSSARPRLRSTAPSTGSPRSQVPLDVGDFRLVDRRALDVFSQMRESNRFVRGMFSWIGLEPDGRRLQARRSASPARRSTRSARCSASRRPGVISFSPAPLRAALNLGFFVSLVAFALGIWSLIVKLTGLYEVPGWTSIVVVTTFLGGIQLIVLGVIGEYIGDIHAEVKRRPLYVVSELENFPDLPRAAAARDRRRAPRLARRPSSRRQSRRQTSDRATAIAPVSGGRRSSGDRRAERHHGAERAPARAASARRSASRAGSGRRACSGT